ncbi:MAG TPA: DUF115 domain-containing protein [Spirochaetota bacterium]|nr:DUF115 domain-containing protein [Spirochaetota bacterium]HPU88880.1 DUF115 domain-containing protein [Spirochaetota bacterium]
MGTYAVQDTPEGTKTLIFTRDREIRLHSAYGPVREASRSVQSFSVGRANLIVVLGCGLGYHVTLLRERFPECDLLVVERDREVVDLCDTHNPSSLAGAIVVTTPRDLSGYIESLDMARFHGARFYTHRPSYLIDAEFYDAAMRDINQYLSSKLSDLLTRFEFEARWVENILCNLRHLERAHAVHDLFGAFSGIPGVIVSAGPSLRKNVGHLAALRSRALIIAVDTAYPVLRRLGIEPHIVMTLDSQKHSLKHFLGHEDSAAALVADIVSYPRILDRYRGPLIMSSTAKYYQDAGGGMNRETTPFMDWVESHIEPFGDIQSGGSIATNAFDLLLNAGCAPIILVGQDLAYTGREIHCSGTHHNDGWLPITNRMRNLETINQSVVRRRTIKYVDACGAPTTVLTDFVFDLYRNWFSDSAAKVPCTVINATEGGARIENTVETPLRQLVDDIPIPATAPADILTRILSRPSGRDLTRLRRALAAARETVQAIHDLSNGHVDSTDPLIADRIETLADDPMVRQMFAPFLKKTRSYLMRHGELEASKSRELILADIATAAKKLLAFISRSKL